MQNSFKESLVTITLMIGVIILQSTLLNIISINNVKPDLSLIILVFVSYRRGSLVGEVSGFAAGLVEDFISLTPLGFSSLIKTIIGFLYGLIQGSFVLDFIFIPIIFVTVATLIKGIISWILGFFFIPDALSNPFHYNILIEIGFNAFFAPILFAILNLFKVFRSADKDK